MNLIFTVEILTIAVSATTVLLIIMNQPNNSDSFGASQNFMHTRRGFEKQIYTAAIVFSVALFVLVLVGQVIK